MKKRLFLEIFLFAIVETIITLFYAYLRDDGFLKDIPAIICFPLFIITLVFVVIIAMKRIIKIEAFNTNYIKSVFIIISILFPVPYFINVYNYLFFDGGLSLMLWNLTEGVEYFITLSTIAMLIGIFFRKNKTKNDQTMETAKNTKKNIPSFSSAFVGFVLGAIVIYFSFYDSISGKHMRSYALLDKKKNNHIPQETLFAYHYIFHPKIKRNPQLQSNYKYLKDY